MSVPGGVHLGAVSRFTQLFAALVVGGALLLAGPRGQLGGAVGALLMVGNAGLMSLVGRRLDAVFARIKAEGGAGRSGLLVTLLVLFNVKLLILAVLIYLCIRLLPIDPLAFLIGLSTLPAAILARAIQFGLAGPHAEDVQPAGPPVE